jgi:hypothetical protein
MKKEMPSGCEGHFQKNDKKTTVTSGFQVGDQVQQQQGQQQQQ